jgi:hypothetical protein
MTIAHQGFLLHLSKYLSTDPRKINSSTKGDRKHVEITPNIFLSRIEKSVTFKSGRIIISPI